MEQIIIMKLLEGNFSTPELQSEHTVSCISKENSNKSLQNLPENQNINPGN